MYTVYRDKNTQNFWCHMLSVMFFLKQCPGQFCVHLSFYDFSVKIGCIEIIENQFFVARDSDEATPDPAPVLIQGIESGA